MNKDDLNKKVLTSGQKKRNTFIFIVLGTLLNILLCIILVVLFLALGSKLFPNKISMTMPLLFIGAVVLAMVIYQKITNWVIVKWNLEEKLEPLFLSKRKNKK